MLLTRETYKGGTKTPELIESVQIEVPDPPGDELSKLEARIAVLEAK